jgi:hypothetical protein
MLRSCLPKWLGALSMAGAIAGVTSLAWGDASDETHDLTDRQKFDHYIHWIFFEPESEADDDACSVHDCKDSNWLHEFNNFGATTESGEPTHGGTMNRTTWGEFEAEEDETVVISTIGSELDTALAVYEGDTIPTLVPVAFNDDVNVPGISITHSLVQLDITKGKRYSIQFGSKTLVNPGYEPGWRRVFLYVNEVQQPGSTFPSVPVASHSVAVRMTPAPTRAPAYYSPRALVGAR